MFCMSLVAVIGQMEFVVLKEIKMFQVHGMVELHKCAGILRTWEKYYAVCASCTSQVFCTNNTFFIFFFFFDKMACELHVRLLVPLAGCIICIISQ